MGSYWIPNNKLKGEGRILYIFTFIPIFDNCSLIISAKALLAASLEKNTILPRFLQMWWMKNP